MTFACVGCHRDTEHITEPQYGPFPGYLCCKFCGWVTPLPDEENA